MNIKDRVFNITTILSRTFLWKTYIKTLEEIAENQRAILMELKKLNRRGPCRKASDWKERLSRRIVEADDEARRRQQIAA